MTAKTVGEEQCHGSLRVVGRLNKAVFALMTTPGHMP